MATTDYIMNWIPTTIVHGMTPKENSQERNQMSHTLECLVALHTCMLLTRRNQN
jgi:hypothetical protein